MQLWLSPRVLARLLLLLLATSGVFAQQPQPPSSAAASANDNEAEVRRLHEEWNSAWRTKDLSVIARLAVAEFRYVAPSGESVDKTALLNMVRSPSYKIQRGSHTEYAFRQLSADAALLTFRWQGRGQFDGKAWADDHRCSFVWTRIQNQWRAAHEHCSAIR